jgi:hypothetical protein
VLTQGAMALCRHEPSMDDGRSHTGPRQYCHLPLLLEWSRKEPPSRIICKPMSWSDSATCLLTGSPLNLPQSPGCSEA